jgi:hypothetical protein
MEYQAGEAARKGSERKSSLGRKMLPYMKGESNNGEIK